MLRILRQSVVFSLVLLATAPSGAQADDPGGEPPIWVYDPTNPERPCSAMPACGFWLTFRRNHPWPYQTFAVHPSTNEATVIISEAPPVLRRNQLVQTIRALFGPDLLQVGYNRWPTGVDGWLEDIVLRVRVGDNRRATVVSGNNLARWNVPAGIADRLQMLHRLFYGTVDGFWIDSIVERSSNPDPIPELQIPVSDLDGWLGDGKQSWTPLGQNARKTFREVSAETAPGVFYRDPGIVAFAAPNKVDISALRQQFRRFAVASDLVLGAVRLNQGGMLLLGRARELPFDVLPPLRFESFATFALNRADNLAQSYERQRIFAGRIKTGQHATWDWAPILLSAQLDDSEFGTLLNLADQILKSWSQHGEVEYFAFRHPKPEKYPFEALAASDYFGQRFGTTSLLFNWNTEGLATVTSVNGRDILTGDRTGALSILYRPSNSLLPDVGSGSASKRELENEADRSARNARDYFAARGNPLLVRVVQNVLLCQAIQSFLTVANSQEAPRPSRSDQIVPVLEKHAAAWLTEVTRGNTGVDRELRTTLANFMRSTGFSIEQMARVLASPQSIERDFQRRLEKLNRAAAELNWTSSFLRDANAKQRQLFLNTCASVGGQMVTDALGREQCKWKSVVGLSGDSVFAIYDAYIQRLEELQTRFETIRKNLMAEQRELLAVHTSYTRAARIAEDLAKLSTSVDLDAVLRDVLQKTEAAQTSSFIRTPTVVLSKNTVDVQSVGGHNIDLIPQQRVVQPLIVGNQIRTNLPSARPEQEALKIRRTGSLLDELRPRVAEAERSVDRWPSIQLQAKQCQCDALVVRGDNGVIYFVRNAPPPGYTSMFARTEIIDAMANLPGSKTVRFENFPDAVVENIGRTASIAPGSDGVIRGGLDAIASIFGSPEGGRGTLVTVERPGKRPATLKIAEENAQSVPLKQPVSLRGSIPEKATARDWSAAFGQQATLDTASDALIVRFGTAATASRGALGVRVLVEPTRRAGNYGRLRALVTRWIAAQPVKPRPVPENIIDLQDAIEQQLKPDEVEFYLKHNQGKVRAAELKIPGPCTGVCRS